MYGTKIKSLREKLGMSQAQLGKLLWSTQSYVSLMEQDKVNPSNEKIAKLNNLAIKKGINIKFKLLKLK